MLKFYIFIIIAFIGNELKCQNDSLAIDIDMLRADNLIHHLDTNKLRVISASRSSKFLTDLPLTVYVITHEEILLNDYYSLTEILKSLPGIRVSQPGSGENGEFFQLRGLTGNFYTKILINGIPVKPSVVTGMPLGAQLPVRQAERIEIIYGPGATIYGADAVAGVINIVTKEADRGTFVRGDVNIGENEYNSINFTIGGKAGKNDNILQYSFYGSRTESSDFNIKYNIAKFYNPLNYFTDSIKINGHSYNPSTINKAVLDNEGVKEEDFIKNYYGEHYQGSLNEPEMEELPSASSLIGINLKFKGIQLNYQNIYRRTHSSIGHNTYQYKYNNPQNYWGDQIQLTSLSYNKEFGHFSSLTQISNLAYRMDNNSSLGLTFLKNTDKVYRYAASDELLFEQQLTYSPNADLELVAGGSYQYAGNLPITNYLSSPFNTNKYEPFSTSVNYTDTVFPDFGINPRNFSTVSGFLQAYIIKNKFTFMGGLRLDNNSNYGSKFSPRISVLYKLSSKSSFYASVGFAYKAPPSSLEFESIAYQGSTGPIKSVIPNATGRLDPEKFRSLELGIRQKLFWNISVDLSFFYNSIYNQFKTVNISTADAKITGVVNDSFETKTNDKINTSQIYGLQSSFIKKDIIRSIRLSAELNLIYSKSSNKAPGVSTLLENFKLMPTHYGQLKISAYPVKRLYIHIENIWESKWLRNIIIFEKLSKNLFNNVDGFFTIDLLAKYFMGQNLSASVKITNLLNEQYSGFSVTGLPVDRLYNPIAGRFIRIGLTYNLN